MKKIEGRQTGPLRCAGGGGGCNYIIFRRTLVKTLKKRFIFNFCFWCVCLLLHIIYIYMVLSFFTHYYFSFLTFVFVILNYTRNYLIFSILYLDYKKSSKKYLTTTKKVVILHCS